MNKEKKTWSDFTNRELVNIYSRPTLEWSLKKKIFQVLKKRGIGTKEMYYGTYNFDAKE